MAPSTSTSSWRTCGGRTFRVKGLGFRARVWGLGFMVWGLGFRVKVFGHFWVYLKPQP